MSDAIGRGLVLVMSIWDDGDSHMQWLDGTTPAGSTKLGAARGSCASNTGIPSEVESQYPNSYVKYSNIRVGDIGSSFAGQASQ